MLGSEIELSGMRKGGDGTDMPLTVQQHGRKDTSAVRHEMNFPGRMLRMRFWL